MDEPTLAEHLAYLRGGGGADPFLPAPPACRALWARGRAAGLPVGRLFVLAAPLHPGAAGGYERQSGDIWLHHDPAHPERTAHHLLHELAHAARSRAPAPATIDAFCDEELATERRARALAVGWGVPELAPGAATAAYLDHVEALRGRLVAAGELAGDLNLQVACRAYDALRRLAAAAGWDDATLADALLGVAEDAAANELTLAFDRALLRARWRLSGERAGDFGPLAVNPAGDHAALLRDALARAARGGWGDPFVERGEGSWRWRFGLVRLVGDADLPAALAAANVALLAHDRAFALAGWDAYGDAGEAGAPRLYHLAVRYDLGRAGDASPDAHLWIVALPRHRSGLLAEAALQRFAAGWGDRAPRRAHPLWMGLHDLAELEQTVR